MHGKTGRQLLTNVEVRSLVARKCLTRTEGSMPRGPVGKVDKCVESAKVGGGNCYFVDSKHSNSWRALRILNGTHNMQYIEYGNNASHQAQAPHKD